MSDALEFRGKTVEDAVAEALLRLGARRDEVEIEVLDEGRGGLLGLFGSRAARVRVTRKAGRGGREARDGREPREGREPRARRESRPKSDGTPGKPRREPRSEAAEPERGPREERGRQRRRGGRGRSHRDDGRGGAPHQEAAPAPGTGAIEAAPARAVAPRSRPVGTPGDEAAPAPAPAVSPAPSTEGALVAAASLVTPLRGASVEEAPAVIEKLTTELLLRAGFPCRCEVRPGEYHAVRVVTDEVSARVLIGRHGATIDALEHLVERMVCQAVGEHVHMNLDVNNYRRRREEKLVQRAQDIAARVLRTGETEHLEPLPARERRVVHLEVAKTAGLQTFTVADGEGKHVVVAPAGAMRPPEATGGEGDRGEEAPDLEGKPGLGNDAGRPDEPGRQTD